MHGQGTFCILQLKVWDWMRRDTEWYGFLVVRSHHPIYPIARVSGMVEGKRD